MRGADDGRHDPSQTAGHDDSVQPAAELFCIVFQMFPSLDIRYIRFFVSRFFLARIDAQGGPPDSMFGIQAAVRWDSLSAGWQLTMSKTLTAICIHSYI